MGRKLHELGSCYDIVKELLLENERYRDSDEALLARYYHDASIKLGMVIKSTPVVVFLDALRNGKFHSADDVVRSRRKVQKKYPETRGVRWEERHGAEKVVRKAFGEEARYENMEG